MECVLNLGGGERGERPVEGVEFTDAAVFSIARVARDTSELVAERLSNEGGGGESTVAERDGLVGVFAREGFYKGPIFGGFFLEGERLDFGGPDLTGVGGYGGGDIVVEVGDRGVGGVSVTELVLLLDERDRCREEIWNEISSAARGNGAPSYGEESRTEEDFPF